MYEEERVKRYEIKSDPGRRAVLQIVAEHADAYEVRITRYYDGYHTDETESMSRELFDLCLRTGYLTTLSVAAAAHADLDETETVVFPTEAAS